MANNINVELDTSTGVNRLNVIDHGGQNEVSQSSSATKITWHLVGELAQACFVPMTATKPGFEWVDVTADGLFGKPDIGANGNSVSIMDTHLDSKTNGEWIYKLRVDYKGTVIETTAKHPGGTVDNPVIINR